MPRFAKSLFGQVVIARARQLMLEHIGNVERDLQVEVEAAPEAGVRLRATLAPLVLPRAAR